MDQSNFGEARHQAAHRLSTAPRARAKATYLALLRESGGELGRVDELARAAGRSFLLDRLDAAAIGDCEFPDSIRSLPDWLDRQNRDAACAYRDYLDARHTGEPRRLFSSRSHALYFLRTVAPTKLVDGAWLYGVLPHWDDPRVAPLIRIYLDELGLGRRAQNHVVIYRQLLLSHGLEGNEGLEDAHYVQGAIQLALAHHADEFFAELIGFNLGYEQLPLHLPITAYELAELDIDPYYFTLHVTIDNAASGHARQALDAVLAALPRLADGRQFLARVAAGYKLNMIGPGTKEAIASFDIERELLAMLARKAVIGAPLHSDYCRVGDMTVTQWLSDPERLPEFLRTLERSGWIKRGQVPQNSRFWRLLHDEGAPMFGAFNAWEQSLIADWINDAPQARPGEPKRTPRRFRGRATVPTPVSPLSHDASVAEVIQYHLSTDARDSASDFNTDVRLLAQRLEGVADRRDAMTRLIGFLSPANHPTPVGLLATRIFTTLLDARG